MEMSPSTPSLMMKIRVDLAMGTAVDLPISFATEPNTLLA